MRLSKSELKQVLVVRRDLKMSRGKTAAQAAHAAVLAADRSPFRDRWLKGSQKKTVLGCRDERQLLDLFQQAKDAGLPSALVTDAGRTELSPGQKTCVGIGPAAEEEIDKVTGNLSLL